LATLRPTREQRKSFENDFADWLVNEITVLAEAFGEGLTAERQAIYAEALADIEREQLRGAFRRARFELRWFPKIAELRELAGASVSGANDGRPGAEEAWARMPKGERREDDTVVWCEEEQIAYGVCRSLLLDGDQIGARMAFKERYERELAGARSQGRPVRWKVSAGYDVESRLVTLASAVEEKRIGLEYALNFVPGPRQDDFARMLPPATAKGLLTGKVQKMRNLPGLPGLLAKMAMQELLSDELKSEERQSPYTSVPVSAEDRNRRLEELKRQAEFLKRSRNGPKNRTA
jgi:hypothetical protein